MEQFPHITDIVITVDQDLQLETDFRLSQKQRIQLAVNHEVTLSYLTFKPFAKKAHQYLAMTSEDDRFLDLHPGSGHLRLHDSTAVRPDCPLTS